MTDHSTDQQEPDPRRWVALVCLLIAGFMNLIDITIVNVALPSLQESFGANSSQIEWIVAAYVMSFALGLLPFGRLGDIIGRRRMFVIGVGSFTGVSLLCGLAPTIEFLVVFRALQGMAGSMMMPQVMAIMQNIFPPHERPTAFSMFGLLTSIAAVSGPVLGGLLITLNIAGLDWRPIFLINLPIGIFAVFAALRFIPDLPGNRRLTNDWIGIGIAAVALFCLVYPLVEGRTLGWPAWSFVMMAFSAVVAFGFVAWERRRERKNASQLLPVSLMRNKVYGLGIFTVMTFFSGMPGFFLIFALFLQTGFGLTPLQSGLTTIPFPAGIFTASLISGRLGPRFIKVRLVLGAVMAATGMTWVRHTALSLDVDQSIAFTTFMVPLFWSGLGIGTSIAVLFQSVLAGVPNQDAGSGSGALQAFQQVGVAIGVAMMGEIFFATLAGYAGQPGRAEFMGALGNAMFFNISVFGTVVVLALVLNSLTGKVRGAQPSVPVEA